jgi:hypothetical protein
MESSYRRMTAGLRHTPFGKAVVSLALMSISRFPQYGLQIQSLAASLGALFPALFSSGAGLILIFEEF